MDGERAPPITPATATATATPRARLSSPVRQLTVVSAVIVMVITAAVAVATALFQTAVAHRHDTGRASLNAQYAQQLLAIFGDQRIVMFRYMARGAPASLAAVQALDTRFRNVVSAIQPGEVASEARLTAAMTAQANYYASFQASVPRPTPAQRSGLLPSESWTTRLPQSPSR